jgi:hypothetical protein
MAGWIEGFDPEQAFQYDMQFSPGYRDWYRGINRDYGEPPNLDAPEYDTRGAWRAGVVPQPYEHAQGQYHWPSSVQNPPRMESVSLKTPEHPTYWMEHFMRSQGMDPNEASPEALARSLADPTVPVPNWPQLQPNSARMLENFPMLDRLGGLR